MGKSASRLAAQTVRVLPRKRLSRALGRLAGSRAPQRVVDAAIAAFVRAYDVDLSEVDMPPDGFRTFDDFFTRRLLAGARVVDPDPRALVSPADGRIEDLGEITADGELFVKGQPYAARRCSAIPRQRRAMRVATTSSSTFRRVITIAYTRRPAEACSACGTCRAHCSL